MPSRKQVQTPRATAFEGTWLQRLRRRKVFQLRMMNKTVREMAALLGAGTNTIIADLKSIDLVLTKAIEPLRATAIINERLSNLEGLRDMALEGLEDSDGNERIGYLNTIAKLEGMIVKLLQDAGVIPKATSKHEVTGPEGKPFTMPTAAAPTVVTVNVKRDADSDKAVELFGTEPSERTAHRA